MRGETGKRSCRTHGNNDGSNTLRAAAPGVLRVEERMIKVTDGRPWHKDVWVVSRGKGMHPWCQAGLAGLHDLIQYSLFFLQEALNVSRLYSVLYL